MAARCARRTWSRRVRRFGLTFKSEGEPKPDQIAQGLAELFNPAVVVIDTNHVVRFFDVTPNWMARTEAGPVLDAVRSLVEKPRASAFA